MHHQLALGCLYPLETRSSRTAVDIICTFSCRHTFSALFRGHPGVESLGQMVISLQVWCSDTLPGGNNVSLHEGARSVQLEAGAAPAPGHCSTAAALSTSCPLSRGREQVATVKVTPGAHTEGTSEETQLGGTSSQFVQAVVVVHCVCITFPGA